MRTPYFESSRPLQSAHKLALAALLLAAFLSDRAAGEEFEQHHAHEHGKVTLNVAVDAAALFVALDAPAINVVGFEHTPRTPQERAAARHASEFIRSGHSLIGFPPGAGCRFVSTGFVEPNWEGDGEVSEAEQGKTREHDQHADYEAQFKYRCEHPEELAWFEPWLIAKLLNVTETRINLITPAGQRSETVTNARVRVRLQ
jgi:hypothetical protein